MFKQLMCFLLQNRSNPMTNFYEKKYKEAVDNSERDSMLYVYDLMGLHTYQSVKRLYK